MARRREQRKYSVQERQEAVKLAKEVGNSKASRQLGIPSGTLSCWSFLARQAESNGEPWPKPRHSVSAEGVGDEALHTAPKAGPAPGQSLAPVPEDDPAAEQACHDFQPSTSAGLGQADDAAAEPTAASQESTKAAGAARRVARRYTPSQRATALETASQEGVSEAARKLGISRWSLNDWRRKAERAAKGEGESPTSGPDPAAVEQKRDQEILTQWREHPGLGPSQIRNQLRRTGVKVCTNTVRRVMEDAGYRPPKVRSHQHDKRFEAVRPNHMWHLDFVQRWIGRASTFTCILLDDYSRYVVGHGVDDAERAELVCTAFEEAVARHGRPELVLHDKGSAFWSWRGISRFTALLEELGIDQVVAEHKEWNGKLEVFNANLQKEFFDAQRFTNVGEMKRRLVSHLHWYNHRRTHHALGGLLVPADRYHGRVEEVMARIESGVAADANDALNLRDRVLEMFKVTSTNGRPEVWLMGQKLLG